MQHRTIMPFTLIGLSVALVLALLATVGFEGASSRVKQVSQDGAVIVVAPVESGEEPAVLDVDYEAWLIAELNLLKNGSSVADSLPLFTAKVVPVGYKTVHLDTVLLLSKATNGQLQGVISENIDDLLASYPWLNR